MAATQQPFIPVGAPVGYTQDGKVFLDPAMVQFLLALWNRTGGAPGTDSGDAELLALLAGIGRGPNPGALAQNAILEALALQRPARKTDLTEAFLFALMTLRSGGGSSSSSTSGLVTATLTASETITAPALLNVWNNGGSVNVRNADNSVAGKEAHAYAKANAVSTGSVTAYFNGILTGLSGLTGGYAYLGATGAVTSTAPTTSGQTVQRVGPAISATSIVFAPQTSINL